MPGDEPTRDVALSKSSSQTSNLAMNKNSSNSTPQKVEATYAIPCRINHANQDLKAALAEKYSEPQYQNVPNDYIKKRKNSVDANTMTTWMANGMPVSLKFFLNSLEKKSFYFLRMTTGLQGI